MKRNFKFLGKGFGENPLFKEGSPRKTFPRKQTKAARVLTRRFTTDGSVIFLKTLIPKSYLLTDRTYS